MRVLLLSRYTRLGASSRLRSYQYLRYLEKAGIEVTVAPLFGDAYVRSLYTGNSPKLAVLSAYIKRFCLILSSQKFDVVWVEKEMLPWLPSWIELGLLSNRMRLIVDYDDAIFHRYDQHRLHIVRKVLGNKIDAVMRRANMVVVGNDYLGERAKKAGAINVQFLPTVVDTDRYQVLTTVSDHPLTIGWIGQASTGKYLEDITPVLQKIIDLYDVRIVAVGANALQFKHLPIEVRPWSEETEASEIEKFDIGIMPLSDSVWEQGKCGYKLIQYMACGLPVIASPVGVNVDIVTEGVTGFLASTHDEWLKALCTLCADAPLRERLGKEGRKRVENEYSLQITSPKLKKLLCSILKKKV